MKDPKYEMMLESFIDHAKSQDHSLVDGSIMIFIPHDGDATSASIFSWVSDSTDKKQSEIWHDAFVAMLFALLSNGVDRETLFDITNFACRNAEYITASSNNETFDNSVVN